MFVLLLSISGATLRRRMHTTVSIITRGTGMANNETNKRGIIQILQKENVETLTNYNNSKMDSDNKQLRCLLLTKRKNNSYNGKSNENNGNNTRQITPLTHQMPNQNG